MCILTTFTVGYCRIASLSARYRDKLQLVLKDVTIDIRSGEKVDHTFHFAFTFTIMKFRLESSDVPVVARVVYA